jgi:hypothetical protein
MKVIAAIWVVLLILLVIVMLATMPAHGQEPMSLVVGAGASITGTTSPAATWLYESEQWTMTDSNGETTILDSPCIAVPKPQQEKPYVPVELRCDTYNKERFCDHGWLWRENVREKEWRREK